MARNPHRHMQWFQQAPCPALRPFVRRFMVVEFAADHADTHLPDTGSVAAFTFRGRCRIDGGRWVPQAAFTGLRDTLRAHDHHAGHSVLLAAFTPVGAAAFLRPSQEAFSGATTDLSELLDRADELERLHEQLASASDHRQRVAQLQHFLLARLRESAPDPLMAAAVSWLEHRPAGHRIDALTRHIGLSQSALERRFRRVVGVTPKKFASMLRLQHAVRLQATGLDLTEVALAAGYYDQAHFNHDFRRATGSAPAAFFAAREPA